MSKPLYVYKSNLFYTYERCGDIEQLTVFGVTVWERAGCVSVLFGIAWGSP